MPTPQYDGVVGGSAGGYFSSGAPSGTTPPPQFFQSQVRPASTMHPYGGYFRSAGEYASAPHQSMPPPPTTLNAGMKRPAPPMNGNSGGDEASPSILMVPPPSGATPTADEGAPRTKRVSLVLHLIIKRQPTNRVSIKLHNGSPKIDPQINGLKYLTVIPYLLSNVFLSAYSNYWVGSAIKIPLGI